MLIHLPQCADISFKSDATLLQSGDCMNSTGVGGTLLLSGSPNGKGGSMVSGTGERLAVRGWAWVLAGVASTAGVLGAMI